MQETGCIIVFAMHLKRKKNITFQSCVLLKTTYQKKFELVVLSHQFRFWLFFLASLRSLRRVTLLQEWRPDSLQN